MKVKTLRDIRQEEFAKIWLRTKRGILNLCPRMGKCRTSIIALEQLKPKSVLIAYPDNKIKESWQADFKELRYDDSIVTYTTHLSLKKYADQSFNVVIVD